MIERLLRGHLNGICAREVLEIGPGYGSFGRVACAITGAPRLTVVDVDRAVLEWQHQESMKAGLTTVILESLLTPVKLSALPDVYDVILCQEVLEHLPDAEEVLAALATRLKPGGRFIITVPSRISELWLKWLNPTYMRDVPFGHVHMFDEASLLRLAADAGLVTLKLIPTQPHFFLTHTWIFGLRLPVQESTGSVIASGWKQRVAQRINMYSRSIFLRTHPEFWGRLLPRNYFLVATRT